MGNCTTRAPLAETAPKEQLLDSLAVTMCSRACNQAISGRNMPGKICKTLRIHTPNLQLARFATLRASDGQVPPCGLDVRFFSDKHRTCRCPPVFSVIRRRKATLALKSLVDHFLRATRWLNLHRGNSDNPVVKSPSPGAGC